MANNAPRTASLPGEVAGKLAAVGTSNGFTHASAIRYHADADATGWRLLIPPVAIIGNDVRSNTSPDIDSVMDGTNGNDGNCRATATLGPDFSTGWGLVNASSAVALMQDFRDEGDGVPIPNRIIQDAVNQATVREYDFVVDTLQDIKVTLAWDDVEAAVQNVATGPMLVNDLDLELEAPDGTTFYPWKLGQVILDSNGVVIADAAQTPGTNITVSLPINPNPAANPGNPNEIIPQAVLQAGGTWVAGTGKDHLNNVEQVYVNGAQPGHWTLRVTGIDVQSGFQDFSVVGFPYPDLPDLVVYSDDKVGIPGLNEDLTFTFSIDNIGPVTSGVDFEYVVSLSLDFTIDPSDATLTDTAQVSLGSLAAGASVDHTSTVRITRANHDTVLGAGFTIDDLLNTDAFLLVWVDSDEEVLEHNEINTTFVQAARLVDVILVLDNSGSMSGTVTVSNGTETKLGVLKPSGPRRPGRHRTSGDRDRWNVHRLLRGDRHAGNIRVHDPRRRPGRRVPARPA